VHRTAEFVATALLGGPSGEQLLQSSLELEVVTGASSPGPARAGDIMPFSYWEVTPDSPDPYDLAPRSVPADTWAAKKLYGERWGHFGAFASKEGRAWDWMWGRLDAAMSISAELLKSARVPQDKWPALQQPLAEAILAEENTTKHDLQARGDVIGRLSGLTLLLEWAGILRSRYRRG
jgi:Protein of unknown function (DUF3376)